jgi:hypothetical protein
MAQNNSVDSTQKMKNLESYDKLTQDELFLMKNTIRNWKIEAIRNLEDPNLAPVEKARWIKVFYRNNKIEPKLKPQDVEEIDEIKAMKEYPVYGTCGFVILQGGLFTVFNRKFKLGNFANAALLMANMGITYGCYYTMYNYYQELQIRNFSRMCDNYNFTVDDYLTSNLKVFLNSMRADIPVEGLLPEDFERMTGQVDKLENELMSHIEHLKTLIIY